MPLVVMFVHWLIDLVDRAAPSTDSLDPEPCTLKPQTRQDFLMVVRSKVDRNNVVGTDPVTTQTGQDTASLRHSVIPLLDHKKQWIGCRHW